MTTRFVRTLLIAIVLVSIFTIGCSSSSSIKIEAAECLMKINEAGLEKASSELKNIGQQIDAVREKQMKLEQVVAPALEWIALEESRAREFAKGDTRKTSVVSEDLEQFKNDQYRVTKLDFTITRSGTPYESISSVIKITDLKTGETNDWEVVGRNLDELIAQLEKNGQTIVDNASLSLSILRNVAEYGEDWEVARISQDTYSISGQGLGWKEKLTAGKWTYYRDKGEITPADNVSSALEEILSIGFQQQ